MCGSCSSAYDQYVSDLNTYSRGCAGGGDGGKPGKRHLLSSIFPTVTWRALGAGEQADGKGAGDGIAMSMGCAKDAAGQYCGAQSSAIDGFLQLTQGKSR